jgi:hypothetical protein
MSILPIGKREAYRPASSVLLILLMLMLAFLVSCQREPPSPIGQLTEQEKLVDFAYFVEHIKKYYPLLVRLNELEGYDWLAHVDEFEGKVRSSANNREFAQAMSYVVECLNDPHGGVVNLHDVVEQDSSEELKTVTKETWESIKITDYWYQLARSDPGSKPKWTPFWAQYLDGKYIVTDIAPDSSIQTKVSPGYQVLKVNGIPVDEFVLTHRGKGSGMRLRYDPVRDKLYEWPRLFFYDLESVEFKDTHGNIVETTMTWSRREPKYVRPPAYSTYPLLDTVAIDGIEAAYVHLPSMSSGRLSEEKEQFRSFFQSVKDLPAIIIDIRGNRGGGYLYWISNIVSFLINEPLVLEETHVARSAFRFRGPYGGLSVEQMEDGFGIDLPVGDVNISRFTEAGLKSLAGEKASNLPVEVGSPGFTIWRVTQTIEPSDSIGYEGKVYVLIDDTVVSAADSFALFCKATGFATLVGTPTSGSAGEMIGPVTLPASKMMLSVGTSFVLNPDFTPQHGTGTIPDVWIEPEPEDYIEQVRLMQSEGFPDHPDVAHDTVLRECLNLVAERGDG